MEHFRALAQRDRFRIDGADILANIMAAHGAPDEWVEFALEVIQDVSLVSQSYAFVRLNGLIRSMKRGADQRSAAFWLCDITFLESGTRLSICFDVQWN